MKLTKIILCAAVAGAMTLTASAAAPSSVLLSKLIIHGQTVINTNAVNNGKNTTLKPTKGRFVVKDIIAYLNASSVFTNYLAYQTTNRYTQIPSGAYLAIDVYDSYVWIVLKDGTPLARLEGNDGVEGTYRYFGETGWDHISSKYNQNNTTLVGQETAALSEFYLYFDDYNPASETWLYAQGEAAVKQSAGKASGGTQMVAQKIKFTGTGDVQVKGRSGTGYQKATGSGKRTISTSYFPLYNW